MKTQDRVENFLKTSQAYRDSDKKLLLDYWAKEGLVLTEQQRAIFMERCTTAETITRCRRKLKGKYPASKEVNEARYEKMKDFQDEYLNKRYDNLRFL